MIYMLDTNICIYIIKKRPEAVLGKFKKHHISDIGISTITLAELEYGVARSSNPDKNKQALLQFLAPMEISAFDDLAALHYGEIREYLERTGNIIGSMDLLIAAHARSLSITLVTNNTREFKRVPGLKLENWTEMRK